MPDPIDLGIVAMPNYIFYKKYLKYSWSILNINVN
jgi:hypothetical protein